MSCWKDNLPSNIGHRIIWLAAAADSLQLWYLSISHWMRHIAPQSPELESPQPSRSLPSANLIQPHAESALHAVLISVSEETWIAAIQLTALETMKITAKEVGPRWEPPKPAAQGGAQSRQGRNGYTLPTLLSKVEEAGCIQKQPGEVSPHCRYAGGKGLTVPPAEEQPTLVSLIYMTCSIASSSTARKVLLP